MGLLERIKKIFGPKKEKLTLDEMILFIQKDFHFNNFHEELIDEIYTLLSDYGTVNVIKDSDRRFIVMLDTLSESYEFIITDNGFQKIK